MCCCFDATHVSWEDLDEKYCHLLVGFFILARFCVWHSGIPNVMHKEDYRALEKMAGEFHSRQLNDTHLFENLLLEKANKNIPCFYDTKPHILFLSI